MLVLSYSDTLTTSMGIWDGAGVTKGVTSPAAHRGIWHGAGATKGVTSPAAHRGIWHSAGVTKSWLHSPRWSKPLAVIEKSLSSNEIFHLDDKRNAQWWQSDLNWRKQFNPDEWKGMLWLPVNVSSLNLSLFLAFPLHSNVSSGRCWFVVVQNCRIPP